MALKRLTEGLKKLSVFMYKDPAESLLLAFSITREAKQLKKRQHA
jgi:hypothetical protein